MIDITPLPKMFWLDPPGTETEAQSVASLSNTYPAVKIHTLQNGNCRRGGWTVRTVTRGWWEDFTFVVSAMFVDGETMHASAQDALNPIRSGSKVGNAAWRRWDRIFRWPLLAKRSENIYSWTMKNQWLRAIDERCDREQPTVS